MAPNFLDQSLSLADLAIDAMRPGAEFGLLLGDPVYRGVGVVRGDGRPVLVLPGLMTGDAYLKPLRDWLRRIGYTPVASGIGRNPGWSNELLDDLAARALEAYGQNEQRLCIVGHSLGGLQGRALGTRLPNIVRHVVALGAPLSLAGQRLPAGLRMTAVFSRDDRVVPHPSSLEADPRGKNVEVSGSHVGLPFNVSVYRVLARVLAAPDNDVI